MFDDFLGDVTEFYDDVDSFFSDLTGGKGVVDVAKAVTKGMSGSSSGSTSTGSMDFSAADDMMEIDTTTEPSGAMSDLSKALTDSRAIESEDPEAITTEWFDRIYGIATGSERNA